ncbi:MAG: hypothetical protein ISQ41_06570 [Flavobacteriaceae bacterium]|nr:hypothetical protein [Flavobacteriaceae bacterium]MBL6685112.1 hypothetical protein [Flavobacteriaceae bacterium]
MFKTIFYRSISSLSTLLFTFISTSIYGLEAVGELAIFLSLSAFIFVFIKFGMDIPLFVDLTKTSNINKFDVLAHYRKMQNIIFSIYLLFIPLLYFYQIKNIILLYLTGLFMSKITLNAFAVRSLGYQNLFVLFQNGNANFFGLFFLFLLQDFSYNNPIILSFFFGNFFLFLFSHLVAKYIFTLNGSVANKNKRFESYKILKDSFIYFCLEIVNNIFTWTPLFVIYFLFSAVEQGIYLNISRIGSVFIILLFILETIVMKDLALLSSKSKFDMISSQIQKPKIQILSFASLIFIPLIFFGDLLLSLIDQKLSGFNNLLILFSLSQIVVLCFGPLALFMKVSENHHKMLKIVIISSSLNILLSFIFAIYFGLIGIFISSIIGNIIWCAIIVVYIKRKYGIIL